MSSTHTVLAVVGFATVAVGLLVKVIGIPDQIRKNYERRSVEGISKPFYILALLSYALWTLYGWLSKDLVVTLGQGFGVVTTGVVVLQIIRYQKRDKKDNK